MVFAVLQLPTGTKMATLQAAKNSDHWCVLMVCVAAEDLFAEAAEFKDPVKERKTSIRNLKSESNSLV